VILLPICAPWIAGAAAGRRWRLSDLGAGEELRNHELARRWFWQPAPRRAPGERQYLRSQGELVRERPWPNGVAYVSMTALGGSGPRLALGPGQHVVLFGATGACKTTTARRLIAGRTLAQHAALFILDQKGDDEDVHEMRRLAAAPMRYDGVYDLIQRTSAKVGFEFTPHTHATLARRGGMSLDALQRMLTHRSQASTGVYTHLDVEDLRGELQRAGMLGVGRPV
jgi:hypothetical protein